MAFLPVIRYSVQLSVSGAVFTLFTPQGPLPGVNISVEATGAVMAILNGRSPTFEPQLGIFSCNGGLGQDAANHILAALPAAVNPQVDDNRLF